jgi:hypothetical protein
VTYTLCDRALEMNRRNIRALAILAIRSLARVINFVNDDPKSELPRADDLTARALAVDPNNYLAHYARSLFLAFARPDQLRGRQPYDNPFLHEVYNRVYDGLRKAGMPEG